MKLRNILIAGLTVAAFSSCSDYLDVDAPSKLPPEYVFSDTKEINRALNGVYASMLSSDTYGEKFLTDFCFNTDVEFKTNSNQYATSTGYQRYDCDPDGGGIKKVWDNLYQGLERANMMVDGIDDAIAKGTFAEDNAELLQMYGEAKVLRAIFLHDLVWYFGDVPYSLHASYNNDSPVYPVEDRAKILDDVLNDLIAAAPNMNLSTSTAFTDGVERISQDMAWAMIARIAMTAAGYTLRPDGSNIGKMERMNPNNYMHYYELAQEYCDKVMTESGHTLSLPFHQVFVNECNFVAPTGDDVIFEIPFAKESTGSIGYIHGPKMDNTAGTTVHSWGKASAGAQLDAHYGFMFEEGDVRRDYVIQPFYYTATGETALQNGRTVQNGKWSKLWNTVGLGATTEGSTGINFPFMRYADVLLMYAEASNALNGGPTQKAIQALEQVRTRAFPNNPEKVAQPQYYGSEEDFNKAILNERKLEFAGENMRWRDLVRNNKLAEVVYMTFFRYYNTGEGMQGFDDAVSEYDFGAGADPWSKRIPFSLYYYNNVDNRDQDTGVPFYATNAFPQTAPNMKVVRILNLYRQSTSADTQVRMIIDGKSTAPTRADYMSWFDDNLGFPRQELLYPMRGYVYLNEDNGQFYMKQANGEYSTCRTPDQIGGDFSWLPPVRYILPYPRAVITRSQGKYENKYGYR